MTAFALETPVYQGPLEALLELIEARKLSITQVSLAEVCDAYLSYLEKLPELPLGETAQFVLVASTLLLIKSRSLLPSLTLTEEERESVDELERRLAQLRLIKNASKLLRKEWGTHPYVIDRHVSLVFAWNQRKRDPSSACHDARRVCRNLVLFGC
jgi:segregation and condensation protein A